MKNLSLKSKLLALTAVSTILPVIGLVTMSYRQAGTLASTASEGLISGASQDLEHIAAGFYSECNTANNLLETSVNRVLLYTDGLIQLAGGVALDPAVKTPWTAQNQFNGQAVSVDLPRVTLGGEPLPVESSPNRPVPIVDVVRDEAQASATIFQRMNEQGDMLRVATSVVSKDGKRAIGTFIPVTNPDNSANPVLAKVLKGETFTGRAFVVDRWFLTSYEPMKDAQGKIIGMLYVGMPEGVATDDIRARMLATKIGETGYVFVFNTVGADRGRYVVSGGGKRDGEVLIDQLDGDGRPLVRDMVQRGEKLGAGEVISYEYGWRNSPTEPIRPKMAKLVYFKEWDWLIGVSTYTDEFLAPVRQMEAEASSSLRMALIVGFGVAVAACLAIMALVRRMVRNMEHISGALEACSSETSAAAGDVARSSDELASGASRQAASIEQTGAALNELAAQSRSNSDHAAGANEVAGEVTAMLEEANERLQKLTDSMHGIAEVSAETQKIVKTIDEIAFQTNILALNAAVEAARAGEAGAGFAVVANEVRTLAQRAAEAARNTSQLIGDAGQRIQQGRELADVTNEAFARVQEKTREVGGAVTEIAAASREQQSGYDQIEGAIDEMNSVVQTNAAAAEESAAAAQELFAQAGQMKAHVQSLLDLINGRGSQQAAAEPGNGRFDEPRANGHSQQKVHVQAPAKSFKPAAPVKGPAPRKALAKEKDSPKALFS